MHAALHKPLGKFPQGGEKEGKRRESAFQISSSFYYRLISVHLMAIVSLVLCKIKATKTMPQMHSIPMEHNRAGQSPALLYWAPSETGNLNSSIRC